MAKVEMGFGHMTDMAIGFVLGVAWMMAICILISVLLLVRR